MASTGYGPSAKLIFDGNEEKYELWEVKFKAYLRTRRLIHVVTGDREDHKQKWCDANAQVYAELVQVLDDTSLSLIIREAEDDGKLAFDILRQHYSGKSKPRIIALYTELTSLKKKPDESVTDYFLRAEKSATALKNADETISDSLLVAMCIKGLPAEYSSFSTVITQRDDDTSFAEFKSALKSFEETIKTTDEATSEKVMKTDAKAIVCFKCRQPGHKQFQCQMKSPSDHLNKWCSVCRKNNHNTKECRKNKWTNNSAKNVSNEEQPHGFAMKVSDFSEINSSDDSVNKILIDCGATSHIICDQNKFARFDEDFVPDSHFIELADGSRTNNLVIGKGDANVMFTDSKGCAHKVLLKNALCIPSFKQDIFSVKSAVDNGITVNFSPDGSELVTPNGTQFSFIEKGNLYYLNNVSNQSVVKTRSLKEWHQVLGHCNIKDVLNLENVVDGMKIVDKNNFTCDSCIKGKMSEYRNRTPDDKAKNVLDLVHCDLAGPIEPETKEGFKYSAVFVDDYSGAVFLYLLKSKSDTIVAVQKFLSDVSPYGNVKCIRSDNGTEFTNSDFRDLMLQNNIKQEFSAPYSPHQNGTAERAWRSIFEMTRCLLIDAGLPKSLWCYAANAAAYIRNRCYNNRTNVTAYEAFTSTKPNLSNMHIFGEKCFAYIQDKKKLDPRSEEGIFVGYDQCSPAYLVYYPSHNYVRRVRCVEFVTCKEFEYVPIKDESSNNDIIKSNVTTPKPNAMPEPRKNPERVKNKPQYLSEYVTDGDSEMSKLAKCSVDFCYKVASVPNTFNEAMLSPQSNEWKSAMQEEMHALKENNTFTETSLPEGKSTIGCKWVYSLKTNANGEDRFKARLVAKGFTQKEGLDYHETFSPTARIVSIRMLLQLAVQHDFAIEQMDVKTAYLNADLEEDIYLDVPESCEKMTDCNKDVVWKLNKSLYGLKQSGRNWNTVFHSFLCKLNFKQSLADPCVYSKCVSNALVVVIIFVDDVLVASDDKGLIADVKNAMSNEFKMKDLGCLTYFLGIDFKYDDNCIKMNQAKCIERILERFGMSDCKPKSTPCDQAFVKLEFDDSCELADSKLYKEIVGSLIYVMSCTRPDITYVVTKLSQYMNNPTQAYLNAAKNVLRYLKYTREYCLKFKKSPSGIELIGYTDSDWAGSEDRKSISGYAFHLNDSGPLVSYKSKKQNIVALSSCEAEYVALTAAIQEAKFLSQLLADITCSEKSNVTIFADNQGAIALAKNPIHHQRSKHIDVRYHYIRSEVKSKFVDLKYIESAKNVADMFTKPVTRAKLNEFNVVCGN